MNDFMTCDIHDCDNIADDKFGFVNKKLCDSCAKAFAYGRMDEIKEESS